MEQGPNYRKIFVVGFPRSGTTWTAGMLGQHPDVIKIPGESHLYNLLYDPFTYLTKLSLSKRIKLKNWIFKNYGLMPLFTGFNSENLWAGLPHIYRFYERRGKSSGPHMFVEYSKFLELIEKARVGDDDDLLKVENLLKSVLDHAFYQNGGDDSKVMLEKTPMHIKQAEVILNSFPEAKMIEVVRDVRSVWASWQALGKNESWARKPTITNLVKKWVRCVELGEKYKNNPLIGERILRFRYEDLRQDTFTWMKTIFEFLELPISEKNISNIVEALDIKNVKQKGEGMSTRKGSVDSWKYELSEADIQTCNQLAGPLLEKLGYPVLSEVGSN